MNEKISVIVPVYNVEPYLERCLDSIINNTYRNLEIICVDDGSPDGCGAILDRYAQMDERFVVIHKENGGVSSARNRGLDVAMGEYIAFVDSDDWIHPQYFEILMEYQKKNPDGIVACDSKWSKNYTEFISYCSSEVTTISLRVDDFWRTGELKACVWGKLYPLHMVSQIRFLSDVNYGEDTLFNGMLCSADEGLKICHVICPLYFYFVRPGSLVHQADKEARRWCVELLVKLAEESASDYIKRSFLLDVVKRSLLLRYTCFCEKDRTEVSAYNQILKKNIRSLICLKNVVAMDKISLLVLVYVPPLYRFVESPMVQSISRWRKT